jgi:hypothetical protein
MFLKERLSPSLVRESLVYQSLEYRKFLDQVTYAEHVLTMNEKRALVEYTGWSYRDYQSFCKNTHNDPSSRLLTESLVHLDSALQKSSYTHDLTLYHGVPKDRQNSMSYLRVLQDSLKNSTLIRKSFFSTSVDPKIASDTTGGADGSIVFEIFTTDGLALGAETSESGIREKEILLPRNKKFKIVDIINDVTFVWGSSQRKHTLVQLQDVN